jgi:threonine synthase
MLMYTSTRGGGEPLNSAKAIIKGIADDKGLYVPVEVPKLPVPADVMAGLHYREVAKIVLRAFFDDFTEEEIDACVKGAYDSKFSKEEIAPIAKVTGEVPAYFLELYHGKTAAFKDMALSILPYLLTTSMKKENEEATIAILTATSGDTGKAALEGFADVPGTQIIVFFPEDGVSEVQKRQMITQEGANTHVFAIRGNFDDAQTGVKNIFADNDFADALLEKGYKLSSANSINIGRLVPQVAYYVYAYGKMVEVGEVRPGDPINVTVPTGNFGNILAAYYAREMGVPIAKFICASNENKVLTDFFETGVYNKDREFHTTNSPSMDILISSNLERLLYHLSGASGEEVSEYMKQLDQEKHYEISEKIREGLKDFWGGYAGEEDTLQAIGDLYDKFGYLMDTHTGVAYSVYRKYVQETGDRTKTIIASTASPYKFAKAVSNGIGLDMEPSDFQYILALREESGVEIPEALRDLEKKPVLHPDVIGVEQMADFVWNCLE